MKKKNEPYQSKPIIEFVEVLMTSNTEPKVLRWGREKENEWDIDRMKHFFFFFFFYPVFSKKIDVPFLVKQELMASFAFVQIVTLHNDTFVPSYPSYMPHEECFLFFIFCLFFIFFLLFLFFASIQELLVRKVYMYLMKIIYKYFFKAATNETVRTVVADIL